MILSEAIVFEFRLPGGRNFNKFLVNILGAQVKNLLSSLVENQNIGRLLERSARVFERIFCAFNWAYNDRIYRAAKKFPQTSLASVN